MDAVNVARVQARHPPDRAARLFEKRLGDVSAFHGSTIRPDASPLTRLMTDHMRSLAACIDAADEG